ncbi:hypothetical protein [Terrimonas pollutisoli]|uniref:hypothetical protein n=1 Tax=Terrimonas pollutisoli TaxID=3034147 RepID=UPI0023EC17D5|nr:hypothetical protein [Terrimonas sp. H1YJ31]
MKKFFYLAMLLLLYDAATSQDLIIKGRIRCINQTPNSTKGAENVVVVPTFMPSRSAITASSPSGYFEFNTKTDLQKLQDKQVNINLISRCSNCKDMVKRIFISEDQDRQNRDDSKSYVTIKKWMVEKNCKEVELSSFKADSVLNVVMKQPDVKLSELGNATAVAGTPALLNLLTTLAAAGPIAAGGTFRAVTLVPGKINYGEFLFASPLFHSGNTGFNFSPNRDLSETVFWNPAAMVSNKKYHNISLSTNVKNNAKLSGFIKLQDKFSMGGGAIFTTQDEFRTVFYNDDPDNGNGPTRIDSVKMKLTEYAVYISPAYKINNQISIGVSVKSLWQDFTIPDSLQVQPGTFGEFFDSTIKEQKFDVDFSILYKVSKSFQIGLNAMNLAGAKLHAEAFAPDQKNIPLQNQRSFGLGLCYKWQRFNFGADLLFTEDDFYDAAFGVNYVPFNDALISAGIAVKQLSYSFAIRLKHFRLAYIDDNDFLINEKRKGKSGVLNGRLYGGFSFSF